MSEKEETPKEETHRNGKTRTLVFRLIGYKTPKRRSYWSSARILLRNHKKHAGSRMQIFQDGEWQSLRLERAEQMAKVDEEEARAQRKAERQKAQDEAEEAG